MMKMDFKRSLLLAFACHAALLFGFTAWSLRQPPNKVEPALAEMELGLVAALPQEVSKPAPKVEPPAPAPVPVPEPVPTVAPTPPPPVEPPKEIQPPEPTPAPPVTKPEITVPVEKPKPSVASNVVQVAAVAPPVATARISGQGSSVTNVLSESSATPVSRGVTTKAIPRYRKNPEPEYPPQAHRRRQEGTVLLRVSVDAHGHPKSVNVKKSSGFPALDEAALDAVRRWEFEPAKLDNVPIDSDEVEVPIQFKMSR